MILREEECFSLSLVLVEGQRKSYEERELGVHYSGTVGGGFASQWKSVVLGKVRWKRRLA